MAFKLEYKLCRAVGAVYNRKPAAEFKLFCRNAYNFLKRQGNFLAADGLFVNLVVEPAALVGRIAEYKRKFVVILPSDVLNFTAHHIAIETVKQRRASGHIGKRRLHFEQSKAFYYGVKAHKMEANHSAARTKVRNAVAAFCAGKARQKNAVRGKAVQRGVLYNFFVPEKFFEHLSVFKHKNIITLKQKSGAHPLRFPCLL